MCLLLAVFTHKGAGSPGSVMSELIYGQGARGEHDNQNGREMNWELFQGQDQGDGATHRAVPKGKQNIIITRVEKAGICSEIKVWHHMTCWPR